MLRTLPLDGAVEAFDPASGLRLRLDAPATRAHRLRAPRSVQFSLTHRCNLGCTFCSRPADRRSAWTVDAALALLADLDHAGVAEVAFGGGEPLVFPGLFALVDALWAHTRLAVHLTTNGELLDDEALRRLRGRIGELRLSIYDETGWRDTLARLQGHGQRFGVNVLVTPDRLPHLPALLDELGERGVSDVLLLPVLGHPALALSPAEGRAVAALVAARWPTTTLKLGVCWGPELAHLPRLLPVGDCGAGREFLELTADRRVRACSFHAASVPFETADDVLAAWAAGRAELRSPAGCAGCPRGTLAHAPPPSPGVRVWRAFASNNSGSYTLVGRFETRERAAEVTAQLQRLVADMEASPEGNPLRELLAGAGIDAPPHVGREDDWPAEWSSRPEAVQVDRQVWWHAAYTVTMPAAIGHWFYARGGRVQVELDHAHHPLLAHLSLWLNLPWAERTDRPAQPLIDALWLGPLAEPALEVRVRETRWHGIEVLWRAPTPDQVRAFARAAADLGLECRLSLSELPDPAVDLDALWPPGDAR
jgi:MoaA/NifB/PqqE/SkfB family radical SAM enzyme